MLLFRFACSQLRCGSSQVGLSRSMVRASAVVFWLLHTCSLVSSDNNAYVPESLGESSAPFVLDPRAIYAFPKLTRCAAQNEPGSRQSHDYRGWFMQSRLRDLKHSRPRRALWSPLKMPDELWWSYQIQVDKLPVITVTFIEKLTRNDHNIEVSLYLYHSAKARVSERAPRQVPSICQDMWT